MIKYVIMSWVLGFSGNKLFGKDKNTVRSIMLGVLTLVILMCVYMVVKEIII